MPDPSNPNTEHLSLQEVTALIIKDRGIHQGTFEVAVSFNIGVGGVASPDGPVNPTVMVGITGFEFRPADSTGPHVVDAADVNPKPKSRKTASA